MEFVRYKNWSPMGDLLTCMPGIRQVYRETGKKGLIMQQLNVGSEYYDNAIYATFNKDNLPVCMNNELWDKLVPLLKAQEYIGGCEIWEGQEFDADLCRIRETTLTTMPHGSIYHWQQLCYLNMTTFLGEKWLTIPPIHNGFTFFKDLVLSDCILINRTERYINPLISYYFLKPYENCLVFAGTKKEHEKFCADFKLQIPLLLIDNFLELAQAIQGCKFFVGNQSFCYHIAEGLGKPRLLEICPRVANVWPQTENGFIYMHQVNLEYKFNSLIR